MKSFNVVKLTIFEKKVMDHSQYPSDLLSIPGTR